MREIVERYPASTLAAAVSIVALAVAAAVFIEGNERLGLLLAIAGPAITTILSTQRAEAGARAARRADEGVQEAKRTLEASDVARNAMAPAALGALSELLRRTERAAATVEAAAATVVNGNGNGRTGTPDKPDQAPGAP